MKINNLGLGCEKTIIIFNLVEGPHKADLRKRSMPLIYLCVCVCARACVFVICISKAR